MKHAIMLFAGVFTCVMICGQTTTSFKYDNSGNRTSRNTITMKSTSAQADETKPDETFKDQIGEHSILIFPNPVKSELTVNIEGLEENTDAAISLFDQGGRLILTQDKITKSNILNLSALSPGTYFMIIRLAGDSTKWTIVKE